METIETINKEVNVTSLYFNSKQNFKSFPRRITYGDQEITFLQSGMRYLVQKGQNIIQLFDMTDGSTDYRLKFDPDQLTWTLLRTSSTPRASY